jgi:hypothetical protein
MMQQRPHCSEFPTLVESCGIAFCHEHPTLVEYAGAAMLRAALNLAARNDAIREVAPDHYLVASPDKEGLYYLTAYCTDSGLPQCSCCTYRFYAETHSVPICQHIFAVQFYREALAAYQAFEREYDALYAHDQAARADGEVRVISREVTR